jgi:ATP-dependent DNA helicase RecQ
VRPALLAPRPPGCKIPIAAFTATADPIAQQTISRVLQLDRPTKFLINPHRPNLHLSLQTVWTPRSRRQYLQEFIDQYPQQAGLVYVRTRHDAEELATDLAIQGYKTAAYHAGLGAKSRRQLENQWIGNDLQFVVCTCAFGMGINKPDVRWIAHYHSPLLLSEYVQEVGRAGRDGQPAAAMMLVCEPTGWLYPEDKQRQAFFLTQLAQLDRQAEQLVKKIPIAGNLADLKSQFPHIEVCLAIWQNQGQLTWLTPWQFQRNLGKRPVRKHDIYAQMPEYVKTKNCRWQYLLTAFGFTDQGESWRCGHCDHCK